MIYFKRNTNNWAFALFLVKFDFVTNMFFQTLVCFVLSMVALKLVFMNILLKRNTKPSSYEQHIKKKEVRKINRKIAKNN